eukprot:scaffold37417_cov63-Phaeocystis_antarctica.AAC.1
MAGSAEECTWCSVGHAGLTVARNVRLVVTGLARAAVAMAAVGRAGSLSGSSSSPSAASASAARASAALSAASSAPCVRRRACSSRVQFPLATWVAMGPCEA